MRPRDQRSLRYTATHEWVDTNDGDIEGPIYVVGLTQYAVDHLTDVTSLELPKVGNKVRAGQSMMEIETVKAMADVYAPVDGEIIEVNNLLSRHHDLLQDPYGAGWIAKLRPTAPEQVESLLDHDQYQTQTR